MFQQFVNYAFQQQLLTLSNAQNYIDTPENLLYFVNSVQIRSNSKDFESYANKFLNEAFEKAESKYQIKIIHPLNIILQRMLREHLGFTSLHGFFLKTCLKYSVPHQALSILSYPALFKYMPKNKAAEFIIDGCDILIKLNKYSEALELIKRGLEIDLINNDLLLGIISRGIVLMIHFGKQVPEQLRQKLKTIITQELQAPNNLSEMKPEHLQLIQAKKAIILDFYLNLRGYRALGPQEQLILQSDGLLQVYQQSQWAQLSRYIDKQVKQNNWRIKATSIKNLELKDLSVIKNINSDKEIYRYDCKNSLMYFNHQQSDQEQLNRLITKVHAMSQEISHPKTRVQQQISGSFIQGLEGPRTRMKGAFSSIFGIGRGPL